MTATQNAGPPLDQHTAYRHWKNWSEVTFGECPALAASYFHHELQQAGVAFDRGSPVLEIGFGNGQFAAWACAQGCDYTGTELDEDLVERARAKGWRAMPATLDLESLGLPEAPRCIVLWDVLEHLGLQEIQALLGSASRVLPEGGTIVARLPSGDSPFAGPIHNGDITHRTALGSGAIKQLAAPAGLTVMQIRAPALPLSGLGWRRALRRLLLKAGRAVITRLVRLLFHDNRATVITANMVVVLSKPATGTQP